MPPEIDRIRTDLDNEYPNIFYRIFYVLSILLVILFFPLSLICIFTSVEQYVRVVIFRFGRIRKVNPRGPGLIFHLPCIDTLHTCDLRTINFDIEPQEVLTKDSVTIKVDAVVYYHIFNPINAILNVENYIVSTQLLAQTTLRNVLGTKILTETLSEKDLISRSMRDVLDVATDPWGIKIERVELKDVRLPVVLQRAMAAEAEATREARAKIVAAEGELQASSALKEASDVISTSPAALQLRYLQTLSTISAERNSTIIFPFPMEFFMKTK